VTISKLTLATFIRKGISPLVPGSRRLPV